MNVAGSAAVQRYMPSGTTGQAKGSATESAAAASSGVESDFLKLANMTPMQRMRASILKSMNLTEDQVVQCPASQREKIEDEIKEKIKEKIGRGTNLGQLVDLAA